MDEKKVTELKDMNHRKAECCGTCKHKTVQVAKTSSFEPFEPYEWNDVCGLVTSQYSCVSDSDVCDQWESK